MNQEDAKVPTDDEGRVFRHAPGMKGPRSVWRVVTRPLELRRIVTLIAIIAVAALVVLRFDGILGFAATVWGILEPLLVGACLAYLLNLIMVRWEAIWFPRSSHALVRRTRRVMSILLSLATVALVVLAAVSLVSGEIGEAFSAIGQGIAAAASAVGGMLRESGLLQSDSPLMDILPKDASGWQTIVADALGVLGGAGGLLSQALGVSGHVAGFAIDGIVSVVFAVYLLSGKERAQKGAQRFGRWVLKEQLYDKVEHVCQVANHCFSRFIVGQCTEAVILGCLVALGMTVLGFPYAMSVAFCVGMTSLVPLIGAWLGGIIGALMIMSVSLTQALWFVVFLVVLQQIEGHVIYPHVVGAAVGVSSIWVLVAVFAGGSLFGVAGVLLGVPALATIKELVAEAQTSHSEDGSNQSAPPAAPPSDGSAASVLPSDSSAPAAPPAS